MTKPIIPCLLCLGLLVGCKAIPEGEPLYYPQPTKRGAEAKTFFRHLHYPYIASRTRRRRIERVAHEMRFGPTEAQLLAQLGPPDWKEDVDGYPPKIPPSQVWYYVHTWKRPMGPHYQGKMILFYIRKDAPHTIESMQQYGLQRVGE